ncbi:MAG: hypothetical protein GY852_02435, partial [bacterium]|nr:hypothetical protein [bacterium]
MQRRILTLLDSLEVREEVTAYSIQLAQRMEAKLQLLMLLRYEGLPEKDSSEDMLTSYDEICKEGERVLQGYLEMIRRANVQVDGTVCQGDPASELLKFLAKSQTFQAVVWGGNEKLFRNRRMPVRTHWLQD